MARLRLSTETPLRLSPVLAVACLALTLAGCGRVTEQPGKPTSVNQTNAPDASPAPRTNAAAELVTRLASLNLTNGPVTATQAAEWKQNLENLSSRGATAISALDEFLARNVDLNFEVAGADAALGVPTLRLALLQAVERIGGAEALALAQKIFRTTADPRELLELAHDIERAEPGKHRNEFAVAARETLALADSGNWDGRDVAPLFELLRNFGATNDLVELERYANKWFAYTAITLARWPAEAGVPRLIKLAQNADGRITLGRDFYWRMLAELAIHSPSAAEALEAEVKRNTIGVDSWPGLGRTLGGHALQLPDHGLSYTNAPAQRRGAGNHHVAYGNQNYAEVALPPGAPAREVGARINLIDRLLDITTNPAAIDALETARVALSARLPHTR